LPTTTRGFAVASSVELIIGSDVVYCEWWTRQESNLQLVD
jgi:hypothetical protein